MRSATWPTVHSSTRDESLPWRDYRIDTLAAGAALCAVPLSIAVSESFLAIALVARATAILRSDATLAVPRVFWFWLVWAGMEIAVWLHSPQPSAGKGEIRHLLLIGALFVILPVLTAGYKLRIWHGIFFSGTIGSAAVVLGFVARLLRYQHELSLGGDPGFYLRNGGFLHHWMVYATVEIVVFGALLEFRTAYPEARRWTTPALAVHGLAIFLSLTRSLWLGCLLLLALHLIWRRSTWAWALPLAPVVAFLIAPGPVRSRMVDTSQPDYYSNAERVQMWRVAWKMISEQPITGVGPGRVEELYTAYLSPGDPVPAYHGHLHNNALQLAAQFGLPTLAAATLCLAVLLLDLIRSCRRAAGQEERFLYRAGLLGLTGFLFLGLMDYTYGHSLGLILLSFAAVAPVRAREAARKEEVTAFSMSSMTSR